jgi:hypothetical protein
LLSLKKNLSNEGQILSCFLWIAHNAANIIKYHFAKPVKKVSNSSALFSENRKTVTLQYPFAEYMGNPEKLNLEVEF